MLKSFKSFFTVFHNFSYVELNYLEIKNRNDDIGT